MKNRNIFLSTGMILAAVALLLESNQVFDASLLQKNPNLHLHIH